MGFFMVVKNVDSYNFVIGRGNYENVILKSFARLLKGFGDAVLKVFCGFGDEVLKRGKP